MKIFIGSESDVHADKILSPIRKQLSIEIDKLLSSKSTNYYGNDITTLCIISTCVSTEFLNDSNWKERVRYSKKDGSTDIRLSINYDKLLSSSKDEQIELYFNNIVDSIRKLKSKYPKLDFQADKLIYDITQIFSCMKNKYNF